MIIRSTLLCLALLGACTRANTPRPVLAAGSPSAVQPVDPSAIYNEMGLIATTGPVAFVGKIGYFGSRQPDSTLLLATISLPNRSLTFIREGDGYRASYEVNLTLRQGSAEVQSVQSQEVVRVASFREVNRTDESIVFQHFLRVTPGTYSISFQIRDPASLRTAVQEGTIVVPRIGAGALSSPMIVYEAGPRRSLDSVPKLLATPRSSAVFGKDTAVLVYLEGYGASPQLQVSFVVQNDRGVVAQRDTLVLRQNGEIPSGLVWIPISRVGIGIAHVTFTRADARDTVRAPIFVTFGDGIPLIAWEEMLQQLRYYASADRIRVLRDTPPDRRSLAWGEFLRGSDPIPATPEHEGLQTYFGRVQQAIVRFRDDGISRTGWLSDRGRVFVALGEPDQVLEQGTGGSLSASVGQRGRIQYWEFSQYRLRLVFYDESGLGRWRLTPASESEFNAANNRILVR